MCVEYLQRQIKTVTNIHLRCTSTHKTNWMVETCSVQMHASAKFAHNHACPLTCSNPRLETKPLPRFKSKGLLDTGASGAHVKASTLSQKLAANHKFFAPCPDLDMLSLSLSPLSNFLSFFLAPANPQIVLSSMLMLLALRLSVPLSVCGLTVLGSWPGCFNFPGESSNYK